MAEQSWSQAVKLRGRSFARNLETYKMLTRLKAPKHEGSVLGYKVAVMHIGAPCCGMNAAVRSFVRNIIFHGNNKVVAIHDGIDGFINGDIRDLEWSDVTGWVGEGGAFIGTKRTLPAEGDNMEKIVANIKKHKIHGLLIVGGFEAYHAVLQMAEAREKYPELKIPICVIPATISNNVPGTEFALGVDTAVNEITEICDKIRQSAQGRQTAIECLRLFSVDFAQLVSSAISV